MGAFFLGKYQLQEVQGDVDQDCGRCKGWRSRFYLFSEKQEQLWLTPPELQCRSSICRHGDKDFVTAKWQQAPEQKPIWVYGAVLCIPSIPRLGGKKGGRGSHWVLSPPVWLAKAEGCLCLHQQFCWCRPSSSSCWSFLLLDKWWWNFWCYCSTAWAAWLELGC